MILDKLYNGRTLLLNKTEQVFAPFTEIDLGMAKPISFIVNRQMLMAADYFSLDPIQEQGYDINIVTFDSYVLMYVINVKTPIHEVFHNGIILRTRKKWDMELDTQGTKARYTFNDFMVITNKLQTCSIFAKNVTADPKT